MADPAFQVMTRAEYSAEFSRGLSLRQPSALFRVRGAFASDGRDTELQACRTLSAAEKARSRYTGTGRDRSGRPRWNFRNVRIIVLEG